MKDKHTDTAICEQREPAEMQITRLRQIEALKAAAGSWNDNDHPELKQGSAIWVHDLRQENERRF